MLLFRSYHGYGVGFVSFTTFSIIFPSNKYQLFTITFIFVVALFKGGGISVSKASLVNIDLLYKMYSQVTGKHGNKLLGG